MMANAYRVFSRQGLLRKAGIGALVTCCALAGAFTGAAGAKTAASSKTSKTSTRSRPASAPSSTGPISVTLETGLAWQIALDREGFSPGLIDGRPGGKTVIATREYQRFMGLPESGMLDDATVSALGVRPDAAIGNYTVAQDDFAMIGPNPSDWNQKAKLKMLGYDSIESALAEKFHCTRALLATLNPGVSVAGLKAGDAIRAPAVSAGQIRPAARVEINLSQKIIRLQDATGKTVGMFHCSIAAKESKRPSGKASVTVINPNPVYKFDPKMYPEVKSVKRVLMIPPGPRNPVGLCWTGLSRPGYGMHGTPNPELIGKTGSHGCFRLANWDAIRLSKMVQVGTPVTFLK